MFHKHILLKWGREYNAAPPLEECFLLFGPKGKRGRGFKVTGLQLTKMAKFRPKESPRLTNVMLNWSRNCSFREFRSGFDEIDETYFKWQKFVKRKLRPEKCTSKTFFFFGKNCIFCLMKLHFLGACVYLLVLLEWGSIRRRVVQVKWVRLYWIFHQYAGRLSIVHIVSTVIHHLISYRIINQ